MPTSSIQESQWKQIRLVERSRPANFKHHFHRWCKQITMWCTSLTLEKYISYRMKWFLSPPFLSVSPFSLLNLARRQCYAYAIGLYTRPEIKSWPDVKFYAHAHCVLPRCSSADPKLTQAYASTFNGSMRIGSYNKSGVVSYFSYIWITKTVFVNNNCK